MFINIGGLIMTDQTKRVKEWWDNLSTTDRGLLMEGDFKNKHPQSLSYIDIGYLWAKHDENAKKCDTFQINEKVSYKQESKIAYNLTVVNNVGVYVNGFLHIPCANEDNIIDDYPVIFLKPSNVEKAKEWWKKRSHTQQENMADVSGCGDFKLLREADIEKMWEKYSGNVEKKMYTYEDMVAIYNLGRGDVKSTRVQGKYIDTHKEWLNENYG